MQNIHSLSYIVAKNKMTRHEEPHKHKTPVITQDTSLFPVWPKVFVNNMKMQYKNPVQEARTKNRQSSNTEEHITILKLLNMHKTE